jgi:glycosyltransferase involved in cell wall biosynthesis
MDPTLSVLLPTYHDRWRLGTQLEAVLSQIGAMDEVIVLVQDGQDTDLFFSQQCSDARVKWRNHDEPLGVCGAYNACASWATGTWIAQLSANDEWQPGTRNVWLDAARRWPDARVMHGHILNWEMLPWDSATNWFPKEVLPLVWANQGWRVHGSATFIRRDSWGEGYPPTLGYMADQFLAMKLTMLHGAVYLRHKCSYISMIPAGVSQAHGVQVERNKEKAEFMRLLHLPENLEFFKEFQVFDKITQWSKQD